MLSRAILTRIGQVVHFLANGPVVAGRGPHWQFPASAVLVGEELYRLAGDQLFKRFGELIRTGIWRSFGELNQLVGNARRSLLEGPLDDIGQLQLEFLAGWLMREHDLARLADRLAGGSDQLRGLIYYHLKEVARKGPDLTRATPQMGRYVSCLADSSTGNDSWYEGLSYFLGEADPLIRGLRRNPYGERLRGEFALLDGLRNAMSGNSTPSVTQIRLLREEFKTQQALARYAWSSFVSDSDGPLTPLELKAIGSAYAQMRRGLELALRGSTRKTATFAAEPLRQPVLPRPTAGPQSGVRLVRAPGAKPLRSG